MTLPLLIYRNLDLDEVGQLVKAAPGSMYGYHIMNAAVAARYVKLYDKLTAPTVGTDVPVLTLLIPASGSLSAQFEAGIWFTLGIGAGAVTAVADNSTAAPSANDVVVNLFYR